MVKGEPRPGPFGVLTREEFAELVAAPYGKAKERIDDPYDLLSRAMTQLILERRQQMLDVVADDDFILGSASELANDLIELIDRWGFLR